MHNIVQYHDTMEIRLKVKTKLFLSCHRKSNEDSKPPWQRLNMLLQLDLLLPVNIELWLELEV